MGTLDTNERAKLIVGQASCLSGSAKSPKVLGFSETGALMPAMKHRLQRKTSNLRARSVWRQCWMLRNEKLARAFQSQFNGHCYKYCSWFHAEHGGGHGDRPGDSRNFP